ncbi:P1 family peptidase [Amycolatopsis anabasis]|uniref:DmpA family aminopeptidase n=1 Tax=Amycolatopsis anabasis TaxID=1840409 RepID=UPI001FE9C9AD|nr:P1 family peptidase [Amycolatopsis anabasis]
MNQSARESGIRPVGRRKVLKASAATAVAAGALLPSGTAEAGEVPPEVWQGILRGKRYRLRELGIVLDELPPGRHNAITDVPGVKVGYQTLIFDRPGPPPNIARTGVTIIVPRDEPVWRNHCYAGIHSHNGNGELTGAHWIAESGWLSSNIGITNTHQVGIVRDTLVKLEAEQNPALLWRLPVVAETWDGPLNQMNGFWITEDHVRRAVADARGGLPAEGNVGGGTGMSFFGYKGGSGTSSRVVTYHGTEYTVGVFAQTNFGRPRDLRVNGAPVGAELPPPAPLGSAADRSQGSCIIIVATDAPMLPGQCRRLAERAGIGLGVVGGVASNGDGDIYLAFSTGNDVRADKPVPLREARAIDNEEIDPFFHAVVEATQEALLNSATKAERMTGNLGTREALPLDKLVEILKRHRLYPRTAG